MLRIRSFLTPYMLSFCYVVSDDSSAVIIDPCEMDEIKTYLSVNNLSLDYCVLTHEHYDHISGLDWIHSLNVPVIASEKCNNNLRDTKKNQSRYFEVFSVLQHRLEGFPIPKVEEYYGYADITFSGMKKLYWQGHELIFKETPGHSEGSICILFDEYYLFCGDTIFRDCETNTNILGGSSKILNDETIPWLITLDGRIEVFPGHYGSFKIDEWRNRND